MSSSSLSVPLFCAVVLLGGADGLRQESRVFGSVQLAQRTRVHSTFIHTVDRIKRRPVANNVRMKMPMDWSNLGLGLSGSGSGNEVGLGVALASILGAGFAAKGDGEEAVDAQPVNGFAAKGDGEEVANGHSSHNGEESANGHSSHNVNGNAVSINDQNASGTGGEFKYVSPTLSLADLRRELNSRQLPTAGYRAELMERLEASMAAEAGEAPAAAAKPAVAAPATVATEAAPASKPAPAKEAVKPAPAPVTGAGEFKYVSDSMRLADLRRELGWRLLPTAGYKNELMERLEAVLAAEAGEAPAAAAPAAKAPAKAVKPAAAKPAPAKPAKEAVKQAPSPVTGGGEFKYVSDSMRLADLRRELGWRLLPTAGYKNELMERLEAVLAAEAGEAPAAAAPAAKAPAKAVKPAAAKPAPAKPAPAKEAVKPAPAPVTGGGEFKYVSDSMRLADLRRELGWRLLPTAGYKNELMERLEAVLAAEAGEAPAAAAPAAKAPAKAVKPAAAAPKSAPAPAAKAPAEAVNGRIKPTSFKYVSDSMSTGDLQRELNFRLLVASGDRGEMMRELENYIRAQAGETPMP